MKKLNLNQQPSSYKRRHCLTYQPNSFFTQFEQSQNQIIANYQQKSQLLLLQSLTILIQNIRQSKNTKNGMNKIKSQLDENLLSKAKPKSNMTFKKQLSHCPLDDEATNPQNQLKQLICMEKTGKKLAISNKGKQFCVPEKQKNDHYFNKFSHQKLIQGMNRLSVQDDNNFFDNETQNVQKNNQNLNQTENIDFDQQKLKNKTISQLLNQSEIKSKILQNNNSSPFESQQEYQITDHQSNQSSNDDDYQERYVQEKQNNTLFGDMFVGAKKFFTGESFGSTNYTSQNSLQNPPTKLNFKPLLDSPKKSNTKKKRLYINKKKVPKWASDLEQVQKVYTIQQQKAAQQTYLNKFGICIVEQLQTNNVCNRNDVYDRASTAKWQKRRGDFII